MKSTTLLSWVGAGALALAFASCSNDDMPTPVNADGQVTFEVTLPDNLETRAFADGLSATNLKVAVYNTSSADASPLLSNFGEGVNADQITITQISGLRYQVTIPLASGITYDVAFWAQSYADDDTASPFTFSPTEKTITVDYSKMAMNTEETDAFYSYVTNVSGSSAGSRSVILYRPFAQINVGSSDYDEYVNAGGAEITTTALSFSNLATTFNLATGKAAGSASDVTYAAAAVPTSETFPTGTNIKYLAMTYVLVGDETSEKAQINTVGLYLNGATTAFGTYSNIPAQKNYQTNIYGKLLTNDRNFNVTINPAFQTPDYNVSVWNGLATSTPTTDSSGAYVVNTAADLAGLMLMAQTDDLSGKTVKLNNDLDMAGSSAWTPIGSSSKPFAGELDGQGHTVKGLSSSLIGATNGANIHDLKVEGNDVQYSVLNRISTGSTTITNVEVSGNVNYSSRVAHLGAAGFVSYVASGDLTIDGCNNRADIVDPAYVGGGFVGRTETGTTVTIKNSNNYGSITSQRSESGKAAGFIALPAATVNLENCTNYGTLTVNTTKTGAAGGMVAWSSLTVNATDCVNEGDVVLNISKQNSIAVAAGIFGGSGWSTGAPVIDGCVNKGKVSIVTTDTTTGVDKYDAAQYAGGIVGSAQYGSLTVKNSSNSGAISATTSATAQPQYVSALVAAGGWLDNFTLTGNTVDAATTLSANLANTYVTGFYTYITPSNTPVLSVSGNTNNTSYTDTAK